jgi:hypothetical protein
MTQPVNLPYGSCLATLPNANGTLDLTPDMRLASGRDVLSQSLIRRQTTPRGTVLTSPNDCLDVRLLLSAGMTQAQLQALASSIRTELMKDQRVNGVQVTITVDTTTGKTTIAESIQSSFGPFTLTLALSTGSIAIITAGQ